LIDQSNSYKIYLSGFQPDGEMKTSLQQFSLSGFRSNTIVIEYDFQPGIQGPKHPSPGLPYACDGFPRKAYLPNNKEGKKVERSF
jgi:deltex-like protein